MDASQTFSARKSRALFASLSVAAPRRNIHVALGELIKVAGAFERFAGSFDLAIKPDRRGFLGRPHHQLE
jgi:hypothetical protein